MLSDKLKHALAICCFCFGVLAATGAGIALICHVGQQMMEAAGRLDQLPEQW